MKPRNLIINGLCRSGNHAIIFWMIHNLVDKVIEIEKGVYRDEQYKVLYLNNVGRKPKEYNYVISPLLSSYNYILRSYEDSYYNKYTNIIILRDFINMLSSRYCKYGPNLGLNVSYICDINKLICVWKQHIKIANKQKIIFYNKWIIDKEYRDFIGQRIGIANIIDDYRYVSNIGDGSSFDINQDYLQRHKQVKLPQYIINHILMDIELIYINKEFFNIDIEDVLSASYDS